MEKVKSTIKNSDLKLVKKKTANNFQSTQKKISFVPLCHRRRLL